MNATTHTIQDTVNWLASLDEEEVQEVWQAEGCSRNVWLYDGVAYKFSNGSDDSNENEWKLWNSVSDAVRELMASCLAISEDGQVLAMEQIECILYRSGLLPPEVASIQRGFNKTLVKRLIDSGISTSRAENLVMDNHIGNMGYDSDGMLKWIDYGFPGYE